MHSLNHSEPSKLILIGASTGGPGHLNKIIRSLSADCTAAIIIAQHIGNEYIPSFVKRLQAKTRLNVQAVTNRMPIEAGKIYICSLLTEIFCSSNSLEFKQTASDSQRFNPDIDQLFTSASKIGTDHSILGIILTGVGDDGAVGCQKLMDNGAQCITESESSAVVYGMPMQAKNRVKNIEEQDLDQIILSIHAFGC